MSIASRLYIDLLEAPDDKTRWRLIAEAIGELEARLQQAQWAQQRPAGPRTPWDLAQRPEREPPAAAAPPPDEA